MRRFTTLLLAASTAPSSHTRYTIDCLPTDPEILAQKVHKHVATLDTFLESKPIARHTSAAYAAIMEQILLLQQNNNSSIASNTNTTAGKLDIILDSGCGTGRSSILLGEDMHPNATVIGVDRSFDRLSGNSKEDNSTKQIMIQQVRSNVWMVRAELVDFWRLLRKDENVTVSCHYLLYPNPYPKRKRLSSRWYGHAAFPLLLNVSSRTVVRSNWEMYLQEMAEAARCAVGHQDHNPDDAIVIQGPYEREPVGRAWTNFEQKYWNVGERTYELIISTRQ